MTKPRPKSRGSQGARRFAALPAAQQAFAAHLRRRQTVYGIAVVLVVAAVAIALTMQGWRSRITTFDLGTYIRSAHEFLAHGALPRFGDTSSHGALSAPGTAWLMVPGALLFGDPRLPEYLGAGLLHLAGLLGLFLLARKYFGTWCATLAVVLYGLSATGLFWAGSLWPVGHPEFFIWTIYLASEWVTRRNARYLAAALLVWALGMYVDMAIVPAFFVLPALWLAYRPPIRAKPLLVAAALAAFVWYPYLRFEAPRQFVDIRSQLAFNYVLPADYRSTWCDPGRILHTGEAGPRTSLVRASGARLGASGSASSVVVRTKDVFRDRLLSNFLAIRSIPGTDDAPSVILLLIVLATAIFLSVSTGRRRSEESRRRRARQSAALAAGAVVCGLLAFVVVRLTGLGEDLPPTLASVGRIFTKLLIGAGLAWLVGSWTLVAASKLLRRAGVRLPTGEAARQRRLLPLSLVVPWLILVVVAESAKPERFWWLWPLQVLFLAAFVTDVLPSLRVPRPLVWLTSALLAFLIVGNNFLTDRVQAWRKQGWSGREAPEVLAVDSVAARVRAEGKDRAAIGYGIFIYPFMAKFNITNPQYKVGADLDVLFRYKRGVTNTDTCAEGFSPRDQFRIVQTSPLGGADAQRAYFSIPSERGFRLVRQFGPYRLYERV